jgi:hypothetical protein
MEKSRLQLLYQFLMKSGGGHRCWLWVLVVKNTHDLCLASLHLAQNLLLSCFDGRKIKRCHERLDKEMPLTEHARANSDRISAIAMEVQSLLKQAEKEGEDGLVDQAQATMSKVSMEGCRYITRIAHFFCKLLFIWHLSADMLKETLRALAYLQCVIVSICHAYQGSNSPWVDQ